MLLNKVVKLRKTYLCLKLGDIKLAVILEPDRICFYLLLGFCLCLTFMGKLLLGYYKITSSIIAERGAVYHSRCSRTPRTYFSSSQ